MRFSQQSFQAATAAWADCSWAALAPYHPRRPRIPLLMATNRSHTSDKRKAKQESEKTNARTTATEAQSAEPIVTRNPAQLPAAVPMAHAIVINTGLYGVFSGGLGFGNSCMGRSLMDAPVVSTLSPLSASNVLGKPQWSRFVPEQKLPPHPPQPTAQYRAHSTTASLRKPIG